MNQLSLHPSLPSISFLSLLLTLFLPPSPYILFIYAPRMFPNFLCQLQASIFNFSPLTILSWKGCCDLWQNSTFSTWKLLIKSWTLFKILKISFSPMLEGENIGIEIFCYSENNSFLNYLVFLNEYCVLLNCLPSVIQGFFALRSPAYNIVYP